MTTGQSTPNGDFTRGNDHAPLSPLAISAYESVVSEPGISRGEIPCLASLTVEAAQAVVDELLSLGLVMAQADQDSGLTAVSPSLAMMCSVIPWERQARRVQRDLSALRDQMEALLPWYVKHATDIQEASIVVLPSVDTVRAVLTELAADCRDEVLTAQPGGARPEEVLAEARERTNRLLARGVSMRGIYQHAAQFSQITRSHTGWLIQHGARVRIVTSELQRMIVFDRRAALISLRGDQNGALLVREPSVLDFIVTAFEQSWVTATPFPEDFVAPSADQTCDELKLMIARLLAEGHCDRTIARRLGISQRTCQRHVAQLFAQVGARNRFHAGYLIHQVGMLIDSGGAAEDHDCDV